MGGSSFTNIFTSSRTQSRDKMDRRLLIVLFALVAYVSAKSVNHETGQKRSPCGCSAMLCTCSPSGGGGGCGGGAPAGGGPSALVGPMGPMGDRGGPGDQGPPEDPEPWDHKVTQDLQDSTEPQDHQDHQDLQPHQPHHHHLCA